MRMFVFAIVALFLSLAPARAADTVQQLEAELQKLESELPNMLAEDTELDTRQDYVDRVLDLRERIEALEQGDEALDEGYYYKLVDIRSKAREGEWKDTSAVKTKTRVRQTVNKENTTFVWVRDALKDKYNALETQSVGFNAYPQKIILGKPFSVQASTVAQKDIYPGYCWTSDEIYLDFFLHVKTDYMGSTGYKKRLPYRIPNCKNSRSAMTVHVGGMVNVSVTCAPTGRDLMKDFLRYNYSCTHASADGKPVTGVRESWDMHLDLYIQVDAYNKPVLDDDGNYILKPRKHKKQEFDISLDSNVLAGGYPMQLIYVPVYSDTPMLENTGTVQHPVEPENSETETADGDVDGTGDGANDGTDGANTAGAGSGAGGRDPGNGSGASAANLAQRNAHIQDWLRRAEPVENAQPGYDLSYDKWGRVFGKAGNGTIKVHGTPHGGGTDPSGYAWKTAETLDSLNLCTLKVYVERKLAGQPVDDCARSPASSQQAADPVPDFTGMTAAAAKTRLSALGVKPQWKAGSTSGAPGTIEKQKPAPGASLARTDSVELWVYRGDTKGVVVPDVKGMTFNDAMAKLKALDLEPKLSNTVSMKFAKKGERPGTVRYQSADPGEKVASGATVMLTVYEGAQTVVVPTVAGQSYEDAARVLRQAGLEPVHSLGPYASTQEQANTVQKTEPAAGAQTGLGTKVTVVVYNTYSEKTAPKTQPEPVASGFENGVDRPGSDYVKFDVNRPRDCFDACEKQARCKAWTYVVPGHQGPSAKCWLKHRIPAARKSACCVSGVKGATQPPAETADTRPPAKEENDESFMTGINMPGNDFAVKPTPTARTCKNMCDGLEKCGAWTFVRPAKVGTDGKCWLKGAPPRRRKPHECCVSGVKVASPADTPAAPVAQQPANANTPPRQAPAMFKCETGIAGLVVEQTGRKYPDRKSGVLETDSMGLKNFICRYNVKGKQRVVSVAFFDRTPADASKAQFMGRICEGSHGNKHTRGKAIAVLQSFGSLGGIVGRENIDRFLDFHVDQVRPYAVTCPR